MCEGLGVGGGECEGEEGLGVGGGGSRCGWRNEESLGRVKESVRVRRSRCGWRRVSVRVEE